MKFDLSFTEAHTTAFIDWYQFTQLQALQHQLDHNGGVHIEMRYTVRTKGAGTARLLKVLGLALDQFEDRPVMLPHEIKHLREHVPYMKPIFLDNLRDMRLHPKDAVLIEEKNGELDITIQGGIPVILFEHLILALISELWSQLHIGDKQQMMAASAKGIELLREEALSLKRRLKDEAGENLCKKPFRLIEAGTRRRFSEYHQWMALKTLQEILPDQLFGTSNVHLAIDNGLRLVGTQAHLFGMLFQQHGGTLATFPTRAMQAWVNEYRGDLGYMLPDVLTTEAWLKHVDLYFAKLFDGYRQDSGDPHTCHRLVLEKLQGLNIDPATKFFVFSDGLNLEKAHQLWSQYEGNPFKTSYLIGTYLTNNVPGHKALSQVIKLSRVNGQPVAKISDEPEKATCPEPDFIPTLKRTFNIR